MQSDLNRRVALEAKVIVSGGVDGIPFAYVGFKDTSFREITNEIDLEVVSIGNEVKSLSVVA